MVSVHFEHSPNPAMKGTWTQYNSSNDIAVYGITGQKAAQLIHNAVVTELETEDRKAAAMSIVLKYNKLKMPIVSIAPAVISNASDRKRLMTEEFSLEAAKALHDGIIAVLNEM